ncbi:hypothetical protein HOF78_00295 [Candidatus Woesearchaeota archaeon]|nr:hypothetical protein [Candidatus Woesearchaeota archaeon]MBT6044594.1 hypothetical protein [Candidatus Woesearchaeota archaeon]
MSKDSLTEVEKTILKEKPNMVAIELDKDRFLTMIHKRKKGSALKAIRQIGIKGYTFGILGAWLEKKISKVTKSSPGAEMKQAIKIAKKENIPIALIDKDIKLTLKGISKNITWKEKIRFVREFLKVLFMKNKHRGFDISKVPTEEKISELTKQLKVFYPSLYKVLITERDIHMSKGLYKIARDNTKVVAVVGAGHINGITNLLKKQEWSKKKQTGKKLNQ